MSPRARWALGALLLFVLLVLLLRGPLADRVMPQAKVQALLRQADAALAEGRLSDADGGGARELYEAALAIDPDRPESRAGLAAVALAALREAQQRLKADDIDGARRSLALARTLSAPREAEALVARQLRERENTRASADTLLAWAAEARAEGRLYGDARAALPLYQRVLEQQPARREALEGREDAIAELLQQANEALQRKQLPRAALLLEAARGHDPGHMELPQARAAFSEAIDALRQQALMALRRQRLEQAESDFRLLLQLVPGDTLARRGLDDVARAHLLRAGQSLDDLRFDAAAAAIERARRIAPQLDGVAASQRRLAQSRRMQARNTVVAADVHARVERLLADARAAEARGALIAPPGDSAFDKLRAARALAPSDARVQRASAELLPAARRCFETELPRNNLAAARACLDAHAALAGDAADVRQARRRLAERWIAVGEERLVGGDLAGASRAAEHVAELEPDVAGLEAFQRRLGAAESGLR